MAGGKNIDFRLGDRTHALGKAIAFAGHGNDVTVVLRALAQRLAQHEDVAAKVVLSHKGVGPHGFHQVVFGDDFIAVADQNGEDPECFRCQCYRLAGAEEKFPPHINAKGPEFVELFALLTFAHGHRASIPPDDPAGDS